MNKENNTTQTTTTVKLDKGTKLILAMIAFGLFLNAVPNLTQSAYAQLAYNDTIKVEVNSDGLFEISCYGCK